MKKFIFALMLMLSICSFGFSKDRMDNCVESTCRITNRVGVGSGFIVGENDNSYFILSNYHVTGPKGSVVKLEFSWDHWLSKPMDGLVIRSELKPGLDIAIVQVKKYGNFYFKMPVLKIKDNIPKIKPGVVADSRNYVISGTPVLTVGAQHGSWNSLQQGLISRVNPGAIYYLPSSKPGRSGSALITVGNNEVIGLVGWMTKTGEGVAMHCDAFREWVKETLPANSIKIAELDKMIKEGLKNPPKWTPLEMNERGEIIASTTFSPSGAYTIPIAQKEPLSVAKSRHLKDLRNPWNGEVEESVMVTVSQELEASTEEAEETSEDILKYPTSILDDISQLATKHFNIVVLAILIIALFRRK